MRMVTTRGGQGSLINLKPDTPDPNPTPQTRNRNPETLNPKPENETGNPKPETRDAKPESGYPNRQEEGHFCFFLLSSLELSDTKVYEP